MTSGGIASIIIAAGYSSRMGSFKPLLSFGEYTAVETVLNTYRMAGIEDIILVVGYRGEELAEISRKTNAAFVINDHYPDGMYSSIIKGVETLDKTTKAFFIHPVDIPLVKKNTVEQLTYAFGKRSRGIIYPTFDDIRGHPPLISTKYREDILKGDGKGGLRALLDGFEEDAELVPVYDEATIMDMDTMEDYKILLEYYEKKAPTRRECLKILESYKVSKHIVQHSIEVARTAMVLYDDLKCNGYKLEQGQLEAAALLHDIARKEKNHAERGAKIVKEELGYSKVGDIILTHNDIKADAHMPITENEILFIADKLVQGDRPISLETRRQIYQQKYKGDFEALRRIKERFDAAEIIQKKLEKISGRGFMYG